MTTEILLKLTFVLAVFATECRAQIDCFNLPIDPLLKLQRYNHIPKNQYFLSQLNSFPNTHVYESDSSYSFHGFYPTDVYAEWRDSAKVASITILFEFNSGDSVILFQQKLAQLYGSPLSEMSGSFTSSDDSNANTFASSLWKIQGCYMSLSLLDKNRKTCKLWIRRHDYR